MHIVRGNKVSRVSFCQFCKDYLFNNPILPTITTNYVTKPDQMEQLNFKPNRFQRNISIPTHTSKSTNICDDCDVGSLVKVTSPTEKKLFNFYNISVIINILQKQGHIIQAAEMSSDDTDI